MSEKQTKYKAKKYIIDGIKFASIVEGEYYLFLKKFVDGGVLDGFELQPKYTLQEKFTHKTDGNIRAITYIADFLVTWKDGKKTVVDVKGVATPDAKNKRKMFLKKYPDLYLKWVSKSKKHGENGWIDYFELEKIRRQNKKLKKLKKGK